MTKAEKQALLDAARVRREAQPAISESVQRTTPKTFEIDGEQVSYEAEKPLVADPTIANAWLAIVKANRESEQD